MILDIIETILIFITICLFIVYFFSKINVVSEYFFYDKNSMIGKIVICFFMSLLIILASTRSVTINGAKANVRDGIAIISAIIGGQWLVLLYQL